MTAGSPVPVVFVHGWAGSAESWQPVCDRLDPGDWKVTTLRLPGSRGAAPATPSVHQSASQLVTFLEGATEPAIVVGHSMGAQVTLLAHGAAPQHVLGEIVIDPAYGGAADSRPAMAAWAERIRREGHPAVSDFFRSATRGLDSASADRILADLHETTPATVASYLLSEYVDDDAIGLSPATSRAAERRQRPVLSLHSTDASAYREALLPAPRGSRASVWRGYGHYLHLEDPDRFVDALASWRDHLVATGVPTGAEN